MNPVVTFEDIPGATAPLAHLFAGTERDVLLTYAEAAFFAAIWPCRVAQNGLDVKTKYLTVIPTELGVALVKLHGDDTLTMIKLTAAEAEQLKKELENYPIPA